MIHWLNPWSKPKALEPAQPFNDTLADLQQNPQLVFASPYCTSTSTTTVLIFPILSCWQYQALLASGSNMSIVALLRVNNESSINTFEDIHQDAVA
jgi:hypothetical protein